MHCSTPKKGISTFFAALFIFLSAASPLHAQLSNLDKATFIEGLRREGLGDLLRHMMETEPGDDPVLGRQVLINLQRLEYEQLGQDADRAADPNDAQALRQRSLSMFDSVLHEYRQLIASFTEHEQRPLWQTELAELLLIDQLRVIHTNAAEFQEFGVPTAAQRDAFAQAVAEAVELLHDADYRLFQLQSELPRQPDHTERRVDTGLWHRMMVVYYRVRTQYSLSHAAYYATLLPDSASYYQNLGRIVQQRQTPQEERARLLALAAERLERLITEDGREFNVGPACRSLLGRVLSAQGQLDVALATFDEVIAARQPTLDDLTANLGRVLTLERHNRLNEGLNELTALHAHPTVSGSLLLRLLLTDMQHLMLHRHAQTQPPGERPRAIAEAYAPYLHLMDAPALSAQSPALRNYIYQRWVGSIDASRSLSDIPPVVVGAMAQVLRVEGQNLAIEADRSQPAAASQLPRDAVDKLQRAAAIAADLLDRPDLTDPVRAQAMLNRAYAMYFLNRNDVRTIREAASTLINLTDRFHEQTVSREAIASAVAMLQPLHQQRMGVDDEYVRAMRVLLNRHPNSEAAQGQRLYYAASTLIPAGEYAEAAGVLEAVPATHPTYFEAQRERLYCLVQLFEAAEQPQRPAMAEHLIREAQRLANEADMAADAADPQGARVIRNAQGHAVLVMADMAAAQGDLGVALQRLEGFEAQHADDAELIRLGLGRQILLLADAARFDEASHVASQMMRSFPADAAAVIDRVLTTLDEQAAELRQQAAEELAAQPRQELQQRATAMSRTAQTLARLLVDWARTQNFTADEMVPFELVLIKSMRLAGAAAEALEQVRPLLGRYPDDAEVLTEAAEAMFALGGRENLVAAANIYSRLASGLQPVDGVYPWMYWNAWMRFFQIAEKLDQNTQDIAIRVRQLELTDRALGGEPFRSEMKRLQSKYAR